MTSILEQFETDQIAKLTAGRKLPEFAPGDTLRVAVKVVEGDRERLQQFEGVCIGRSNAGLNSNFTVRKISYGEGVERVFPLYSPHVANIEVVRRGTVRRAKLYYLRKRSGKSARIAEKVFGLVASEGAVAAASDLKADAAPSPATATTEPKVKSEAKIKAESKAKAKPKA